MKKRALFFVVLSFFYFTSLAQQGVQVLTDANFNEKTDSAKLTIIDFCAEWSGPCRKIAPLLQELAREYDGLVNFGQVNVDENPFLSANFKITSIPFIIFVKGNKVLDTLKGSQPKSNFIRKIKALQ